MVWVRELCTLKVNKFRFKFKVSKSFKGNESESGTCHSVAIQEPSTLNFVLVLRLPTFVLNLRMSYNDPCFCSGLKIYFWFREEYNLTLYVLDVHIN